MAKKIYHAPKILRRTEGNKNFPTVTTGPLEKDDIPKTGSKVTIQIDDGPVYTGILTRVIALDSGTKLEFKKGLLQGN